jgi:hypothetical protein
MVPTLVRIDEKSAEKTENEVEAVLIHLKKLLRLKNRLRSPLLRLPIEIIVHILSHTMEDAEHSSVWWSVLSICHHIRNITCTATELWQKANFTLDRHALLAFMRSQGNLRAITVDLWCDQGGDYVRNALSFCRDNLTLRGHKLRVLDVRGHPSDITNFSWIFNRPLPRLEYAKIHFSPSWGSPDYMQDPVILQLPADLPLRVLDLANATLPWSSYRFTELRELHLDFTECDSFVEISEEELLGILEASPRLESLSLIRLIPIAPVVNNQRQYTPARIVKFTNLASLDLDNFPMLVEYTLAHMDVPAINSLKIRAEFSLWEVEPFLDNFYFDDLLPDRLFLNPPIFEICPDCGYGIYETLNVKIGSIHIQSDSDMDEDEEASEIIMVCVFPLVPPSVTALRLGRSNLGKDEWMEFFRSHTEVRSIESSSLTEGFRTLISEPLWDALSPGADAVTLCPKLESISLPKEPMSAPLFNCLLNRKTAGYGLKHLTLREADDRSAEKLRLSVEELRVVGAPDELVRRVRRILRDKMDHALTTSQWGERLPRRELDLV